jgi:hypothetical protein
MDFNHLKIMHYHSNHFNHKNHCVDVGAAKLVLLGKNSGEISWASPRHGPYSTNSTSSTM